MSSLGDSARPSGTDQRRRRRPSTTIVWARRGVLVVLRDSELGRRVADIARSAGLEARYAQSVSEALGAWSDQVGAVIVDAAFSREAVPLIERASEADAVAMVAGTTSDGEATLRLLEAGARTYLPLPESPERIARRLHEEIAYETEFRGGGTLVELIKSRSELQAAFDTFPSPLLVMDRESQIHRANRAALLLARRESFKDILHRPAWEVYGWHTEDDCPLRRAIEAGEDVEYEVEVPYESPMGATNRVYRCRVFAGSELKAASDARGPSGPVDGVLVLLEDVTVSTREESERARREKLESVALLAGTLSHEVNQPLGTILGRAQLALLGLDQPDAEGIDLRRDLTDIVENVARVSEILDRLHQVTDIVTKTYPGGTRILDLEESARLVGTARGPDDAARTPEGE